MLERCRRAQIKQKDLNLNLETSPAWFWPLQHCILLHRFFGFFFLINFEFFCFEDLPDMLERCRRAQIKDKHLNFNLETSPAWFWPLQPCILLRRFFLLLPSINFEFFCFEDLPDMLERCRTAQIKDKDLNLNLETSPAWFWPLQHCILLHRFFGFFF